MKRSDLTESLQPDKLSASSIYHETNGGIHAIPLFARHMQHVKQTVREKVKGWKMWQHLCVCALMVIKYHHGPSTKESRVTVAALPIPSRLLVVRAGSLALPACARWAPGCLRLGSVYCHRLLHVHHVPTWRLGCAFKPLKRINEELLCAFNEGIVLIESAPVCLALLLHCLDVLMLKFRCVLRRV